MQIPLNDLKKQYLTIKDEVNKAISDCLDKANFVLGEAVENFEKEICKYNNSNFAVGVASGTDALVLALQVLNIKKNDEVITTPFTFIATAEAIYRVGAKPVFVDIKDSSLNIDAQKIQEKITKKTKAIMPVHLFGQPADMEQICKIAKANNLHIIEDAAQSLGAEYKGIKVSNFGIIGCVSFYPGKNLGGYGDGGLIFTKEKEIADKLKILRVHGAHNRYFYIVHGYNSRLDALQAAILRVKLKYLDKWNKARYNAAQNYKKLFSEIKQIILPTEEKNKTHIYNMFTVRFKGGEKVREKVINYLQQQGISSVIHYPLPLHLQKVYSFLKHKKGDFPVAEKVATQILSIPLYPEITLKEQKYVAYHIGKALG